MIALNYWAVVAAAAAALVAAAGYYVVFGTQLAALGRAAFDTEQTPPWLMPVELVKHLLLAVVVAGLAANMGIAGWTGAVLLGLVLWLGFPVVLLTSSVIREKVPWKLAALHAGDWLVKLVLIAVIVNVWR